MAYLLICIDGIDASGKSSVARELANRLHARVIKVPALHTPTGQLIKKRLTGKYNPDPLSFALLHTANMFELQDEICRSLEKQHTILVRWQGTSIAYGISDGVPESIARALAGLLITPDISFYLSIPVEVSFERKRKREEVFERDYSFLEKARSQFEALADESGWEKIDATPPLEQVITDVESRIAKRLVK